MNTSFLSEDFLLESKTAKRLYHEYAEPLPTIDYHNHLSPAHIAQDHRFENLTRIWLADDHYKWRAMRACGVPERLITGNASDREKFNQWCAVVPKLLGNPLYHWTHMELAKPFGMSGILLNSDTAESIWKKGQELLAHPDFSVRQLLHKANVEVICTTDDPADDLAHHAAIASDKTVGFRMFPTFRPDNLFQVSQPDALNKWLDQLSFAAGTSITDWASLLNALNKRCDFFHAIGCRVADHGLEQPFAATYTDDEIETSFRALRDGRAPDAASALKLQSAMLYELGLMYHQRGWVQQFHLGALRNTNTRLSRLIGRDAGCDTIGDAEIAAPLARLLDRWDRDNRLAKTILYNLNPRDNEMMAAMCGNFQDGSIPGKIQYGAAWWFLDQKDGIEKQLIALSNLGVLSLFVGMVTDSRSFLSFSRHEYFRRILCNMLGGQLERGLLPNDVDLAGSMVKEVCYGNAKRYFNF